MRSAGGEPTTSRRRLFQIALWACQGALGLLVGVPAVGFLLDPLRRRDLDEPWLSAGAIDRVPEGEPHPLRLESRRRDGYVERSVTSTVWILRDGDRALAFSGACTHLGCNIAWNPSTGEFECPCHGGRFSRAGEVLGGPPRRPLDRFETRTVDGALEIRRIRT
ncbi:MAG: Rieske (2Fe-2S) protein [Planctomycetes bacterium]|nr:Rieske (2Fe-2S) protein [Planctomycetota bacterium]